MTIVFRSKVLDHTHTGNSYKNIQRRGTDWNSLRDYENDDTRDIAWSRSTSENIYVKERQNQGSLHIVGVFIGGNGDDFFVENIYESKGSFSERAKKLTQNSAGKSNYSYRSFSGFRLETIGDMLLSSGTKNTLILIFRSYTGDESIPKQILKLSVLNDLILVDIYHPFEYNPQDTVMIDGKIVSHSSLIRYKKKLDEKWKDMDYILRKKHIAHIRVSTHENIENRLNYFFKERYHG